MKDSTPENNPVDEAIADAATNPANPDDAAPVVLTKAEKAARRKADNLAKKELAAKEKKAAEKVKQKEAFAKKKAADDAKALVVVNRDCMVQINQGLKAIQMGQKVILAWSVAAFNLKGLCDGNKGVNYGAMALEHWSIDPNTASKLATAGAMVSDLLKNEGEKGNWLPHLPQNNLNTLSMIARLDDDQIDAGIDQEIIHPKATEKAITEYANTFRDPSVVKTVPKRDVPGTPAADAEAEAALSESDKVAETPAQLMARLADAATDLKPAQLIQLIATMAGNLKGKRVEDLFTALEVVHPAPK